MESVETLEKTTFCGRRFTRAQLARVQETVHTCPHLSRNELALTLCEHLDWTTPKGTYKVRSCLKLVEALEARGIICLPATRQKRASVHAAIPFQGPDAPIDTSLDALAPISLHPVTTAEDRALWRSYVESHHYLGYKRPIGAHLFYFVAAEARQQKLGCVSFSARRGMGAGSERYMDWLGQPAQRATAAARAVPEPVSHLPRVNVANLAARFYPWSLLQNPPGERVSALQDGRRRGPASPGVTAARVVEASVGAPRDVPPHGAFLPVIRARARSDSWRISRRICSTVRWFAITRGRGAARLR